MNRPLRHAFIVFLICAGALYAQNAPRDTSSLEKSLVGHWVTRSATFGDSHYYFSAGKLTLVHSQGSMDMTYTVLESNPKARELQIRVMTKSGKGHDKKLVLSADSTSLDSTIKDFEATTYSIPTTLTYLDAKQAP